MRHLKTAWRHIRRSPYQAFAAVFIMAQTFFVLTFFAFLIFASSRIIAYFESVPQVTAFFKEEAKQEDIDTLSQKVKETGKIAKLEFVSKEEALKIYKEQNKDDPLLLELVTAEILPAALKVSAIKIDDLTQISEMLSGSIIVERVIFQKDVVQNLAVWTNALRKIGIALSAILALDAIFLMVIIIGIKISQKKDEIEIVRLIGATGWYVRWPFIYEGVFYGVSGAFLGWLLALGLFWYATPFLSSFLKGIPLFPIPIIFFFQLLGIELLIAIFLGIVSSFLSVLRYLK
ncbi:MAG: ABC transporter permease [Candidatus Levyibacteriota bacterium]|nr:MAG: ABC transporter permease [Candidatus Levybacteria bacterium]